MIKKLLKEHYQKYKGTHTEYYDILHDFLEQHKKEIKESGLSLIEIDKLLTLIEFI